MQGTQLRYAIKFVADMDKAVKFYRDVLGLKVKFESPGWSEFLTGEITLALHPASDKNPAGKVELGFTVADVFPITCTSFPRRPAYLIAMPRSAYSSSW
jgi:catechol 2,3-dioxygenase-like lactoylglutathione lyase family enzyme